jgi:hypothetical protein
MYHHHLSLCLQYFPADRDPDFLSLQIGVFDLGFKLPPGGKAQFTGEGILGLSPFPQNFFICLFGGGYVFHVGNIAHYCAIVKGFQAGTFQIRLSQGLTLLRNGLIIRGSYKIITRS